MRNPTLLQWIEEAEARRVLTTALFERSAEPSWHDTARATANAWLCRPRTNVAVNGAEVWPALHLQPATIRRPAARLDANKDYSCCG